MRPRRFFHGAWFSTVLAITTQPGARAQTAPVLSSPPPASHVLTDAAALAAQHDKERDAITKASVGATDLPVTTNVGQNVDVVAVLLPPDICRHIFGGRIGNRYAAVELIISNRSDAAAFVLQSAFLDYSDWLLNGLLQSSSFGSSASGKAAIPPLANRNLTGRGRQRRIAPRA